DGLSVTEFRGDYGFEKFIARGGVASDEDLIRFLADTLMPGIGSFLLKMAGFGCSTISVESGEDGYYFGRNFDWSECDKQILFSYPDKGYASVSTVNIGFIQSAVGNMSIPENVLKMAALYTPLDGMNEKGLCVAVNMIEDDATIDQNTDKPDVTTTTAVRLLLNKAADTKEAVELLKDYDMHASFGYMVHFAIADAKGDAVAAEYIDDELVITETPVLTNFYVSEGKKYGIGTEQSHERFDVLKEKLSGGEEVQMTRAQVRDALEAASKKNFSDTERTEWSIVYDQKNLNAQYYNREDFEKGYLVEIRK
nr:linear amide C-N hydrolase [Lachnospiraceae bacterium]